MAADSELSQTRARPAKAAAYRFALIDLASAAPLRPTVPRLLSAIAQPLFARTQPMQILEVGPWLVEVAEAPEIERALAAMGPDAPWGYYVHANVDILSVRQSLRKFNLAQLPDKTEVLFRYWDPRVIRTFLDGSTPVQRGRFMEWIEVIEWPDGSSRRKPSAADFGR